LSGGTLGAQAIGPERERPTHQNHRMPLGGRLAERKVEGERQSQGGCTP